MQNIFSKTFELRTSDFDANKKMLPSNVLDLFQVVAGEHANILGCGIDTLMQSDLIWVLVRTKYTVIAQPKMFSTVRVKTWPLPPSRVGFQRDYLMETEDGTPLIKASSDWVIINSKTRKIAPAGDVYPKEFNYTQDKNFDGRLSKIADFEAGESALTITPGYSQLDMNGHVNNTKYANYAVDALNPTNEEIVDFQIDYRKEVKCGETLNLYIAKDEKTATVKGVTDGGDVKFMAQMKIK